MRNFIQHFIILASFVLLLGCLPFEGLAQKEYKNIVPNPGFEEYSAFPIGWFYTGRHFSKVQKYWFSSTQTSPDVYGPNVRVPQNWKDKGFGNIKSPEGKSFVGITTYGCDSDKPHCKEYIEVQLKEPLVPGQNYQVSVKVAQLPNSTPVNNIGFVFSDERVLHRNEDCILLKPTVNFNQTMSYFGKWAKLHSQFVANTASQYVVIGNFYLDNQTVALTGKYPYAYFYLDDVVVKKVPPIIPVPVDKHDLQFAVLVPNKLITLHNIYFEFDKADLHPRSQYELKQLTSILKSDPTMVIQIIGHTDDMGTDDYNNKLSIARAIAVKQYLINNQISAARLEVAGKGDTEPMATNNTESGRQKNRRIEFRILKMNPNASIKISGTATTRGGL